MVINGYILSYINPDTDGVCSALAIAELYKKKGMGEYLPVLSGKLSAETKYVLDKADIDQQLLVTTYEQNKPIILVDTHQLAQLPHLKKSNMVVEIWDHHPDGDVEIFVNAIIHNYKIGAIASKILEKMLESDCLSRSFAILLGSAIVSNTINFTAPSTTKYDIDMFSQALKYFDFNKQYIDGMFQCRDSILNEDCRKILTCDMKCFQINEKKCLIAQIELTSTEKILKNKNIFSEIRKLRINKNAYYFVFNVINIQQKKSFLICEDEISKNITEKMFGRFFEGCIMEFEKILLRKTELVPLLSEVLINGKN